MSWIRFDDQVAMHPKVLAAGNEAVGAWFRLVAHCGAYLTDGAVSDAVAASIANRKVIGRLVEVGLLDRLEDGSLQIHDYLAWNPTAEEVHAERAARSAAKSEAGKRGGIASGIARRRETNEANAKQKRSKREAETKQTRSTVLEPNGSPASVSLEANAKRNEAPSPSPSPSPPTEESAPPAPNVRAGSLTEAIGILAEHGIGRDVAGTIRNIWTDRSTLADALRCVFDTAPPDVSGGFVVAGLRKLKESPEILDDYLAHGSTPKRDPANEDAAALAEVAARAAKIARDHERLGL